MKRIITAGILCLAGFSITSQAVEFSVFGDVQFVSGLEDENNFALGSVDIVTQHNLSDKTYAIVDILFEIDQNHIDTEIERLSINHSVSDKFEIGVGRYMKPLGFWNHNFVHGSLSQHTVTRPFLIEIEDTERGFLPSHLIGLLMGGESRNWTYQFAVANTDGVDSSDVVAGTGPAAVFPLNNMAPNDAITLFLRTTYRVTDSFELGFMASSHNYTEVSDAGLVSNGEVLFEQNFVSLDFNYFGKHFYTFAEYYYNQYEDNQDLSGGGLSANPDPYNATAYYIQLGYYITRNLTVVTRYESLEYDDNATLFLSQAIVPQTEALIGLNLLLEESHALRFEAKQIDPEVGESENVYYAQWFFYLL